MADKKTRADKKLRHVFAFSAIVTPIVGTIGGVGLAVSQGDPNAFVLLCLFVSGITGFILTLCLTILAYRLLKQTDMADA